MAYATADDLDDYVDTVPANAARLLTRASRVIDGALKCAVYDVDEAGDPTDADVITALKDATCEQAAYWITQGSDEGIPNGYTSVSIGSVALAGGQTGNGGGPGTVSGELCAQARQILDTAGLLNFAPWTW
ncbi:hypothetical protein E1287_37610 [Actinomadura sp. KC06]|uniref:hypothetical protein n=1 Tax=Actinomadura sp. KC06 TaxID=2530369 RepID=UPI001045E4D4|nr:hypothetical protein [Actinomadura sp. KC06]TDD25052.1 hypothetical protein E1287_37610 [Actinomadura sp. KC06]